MGKSGPLRRSQMRSQRTIAVVAVTAAVLLLAGLPLLGGGSRAAATHPSGVAPTGYYTEIDSGSIRVLFGAPLPTVEILSRSNASYGAQLVLQQLLEIAPNSGDPSHPFVVSAAAPQALQRFNGTLGNGSGTSYVSFIAALPVRIAGTTLWSSSGSLGVSGAQISIAVLEVNYTLVAGVQGSQGVLLSWSVAGWPWLHAGADQLALEYQVELVSGNGFAACSTGTAQHPGPGTRCPASGISVGQIVWNSSLSALQEVDSAGPAAWVGWGANVLGANGTTAPVDAGAYHEESNSTSLVIASPAGGSSAVTGTTIFLLTFPVGAVGTIVGFPLVYGAVGAASAAVAVGGIAGYRRRDRALRQRL